MRAYQATVSVTSSVETALVAAEEKVVLTSPPVATQAESGLVIADGSLQCLMGAGGVTFQIRVRRGSLTGPLVFTGQPTTTVASTSIALPFNYEDRPGEVVGQLYVVTATTTGGPGTMKFATLNLSY